MVGPFCLARDESLALVTCLAHVTCLALVTCLARALCWKGWRARSDRGDWVFPESQRSQVGAR